MRTTLNLDDNVVLTARGLARREVNSIGAVVSDLARQGLNGDRRSHTVDAKGQFYRYCPLPMRGSPVTNDLIDRFREDGPY